MTRLEKIQRLNAIAEDYEKGMSLPALAEKYGVCVRTCYRAIDKDAVKERTVALNEATKLDTEILNDYIANMSVTNIAAKNKPPQLTATVLQKKRDCAAWSRVGTDGHPALRNATRKSMPSGKPVPQSKNWQKNIS